MFDFRTVQEDIPQLKQAVDKMIAGFTDKVK
jgi:hypothetical protein